MPPLRLSVTPHALRALLHLQSALGEKVPLERQSVFGQRDGATSDGHRSSLADLRNAAASLLLAVGADNETAQKFTDADEQMVSQAAAAAETEPQQRRIDRDRTDIDRAVLALAMRRYAAATDTPERRARQLAVMLAAE